MPSTETLSRQDRATLIEIARRSIRHGLEQGEALGIDPEDYPETLRPSRATFVTLELEGQLRGCIGTLAAHQPLVSDVAEHAHAAAFDDPRFPAVTAREFPRLAVFISVLSPAKVLAFDSEESLLQQLRPGVDGLILHFRGHRATFLPAVWESLSDPYVFLAQLKQKAGLPLNFWSPELRAERYTTEYFGDADIAGSP